MYKVLTKLLENTLKKVAHKVMSESQIAFFEGCQMEDYILIANEFVIHAKMKNKKALLFKVDFEKAYDIW